MPAYLDPPDDYWDIYEAWCEERDLDPEDGWQSEFRADMAEQAAEARAEARAYAQAEGVW